MNLQIDKINVSVYRYNFFTNPYTTKYYTQIFNYNKCIFLTVNSGQVRVQNNCATSRNYFFKI